MTRYDLRLSLVRAMGLFLLARGLSFLVWQVDLARESRRVRFEPREPTDVSFYLYWFGPPAVRLLLAWLLLALAPRIAAGPHRDLLPQPARVGDVLCVSNLLLGLCALDLALERLPNRYLIYGSETGIFPFQECLFYGVLAAVLLVGPARAGGWLRRTFLLPRARDVAGG